MSKDITECTQAPVIISLPCNQFDKESLLSLKELLEGPIKINTLALCGSFDTAKVDLGYALKCIIEGLAYNLERVSIDFTLNCFDASHIYHIVLMLRQCFRLVQLTLNRDLTSSVLIERWQSKDQRKMWF